MGGAILLPDEDTGAGAGISVRRRDLPCDYEDSYGANPHPPDSTPAMIQNEGRHCPPGQIGVRNAIIVRLAHIDYMGGVIYSVRCFPKGAMADRCGSVGVPCGRRRGDGWGVFDISRRRKNNPHLPFSGGDSAGMCTSRRMSPSRS